MQSRSLLNLALLALVILLSVYVYTTQQRQARETSSPALTSLSADAVTRIGIRHNQRQIELVKLDSGWHMRQPIDIAANGFRIDTLLNMLETAVHASYPAVELEPGKYGLADASTAISFNDITIEFGIVNPINNYRYVRVGDSVHMLDDHFYPLLSSQTGTLIARELISGQAAIEKLVLPQLTLYRDENNVWQSSAGTDPDIISATLEHWKTSQAFGVHNYLPRDPLSEISVHLEGEPEPVRFLVTDMDPWLIIARPDLGLEYHFNLEFYERLIQPGAVSEGAGN